MEFLQGIGYKLDIVFVIDATGSMGPIMTEVKQNALVLGDKIKDGLDAAGKSVSEMRVKIIDFADFANEGEDAINQTEFFPLPDQKTQFEAAVNNIEYQLRGGDVPENGLEALYAAICSDWVKLKKGEKGRHIIVVMTDAVPLHLRERDGSMGYPTEEFPTDLAALESIWSESDEDGQSSSTDLNPKAKRLILFVPKGKDSAGHTWEDVASWQQTVCHYINPAEGLGDISFNEIVDEIVRSC